MSVVRSRAVGLAGALILGVVVLAGCGSKATPTKVVPPANNAPAASHSTPPASPSSGSGGGYGY